MLSLRKQPTPALKDGAKLILIGIGAFMLAFVGCSEKDALSPTEDTSLYSDYAQLLAPLSYGGAGNSAMPGNPQSVPNDMMNGEMMGGGMMNGGMMGGMMGWGGWGWNFDEEGLTPLTIDQAVEAVEEYLAAINNPNLALAEVMEFDNHFYAEVYEKSTGIGALEILIDLYTGIVHPEPGPNMMWNTKYGHKFGRGGMGMMGGMGWTRGRFNGKKPTAEMPVTAEKALEIAQKFLDTKLPGTQVAEEADRFYGYYTIHLLKDGEIYGMFSVNGYTGQVWYHSWHGDFVGIKELEE